MARIDWKRARKFSGSVEKYEPGKVLDNGRVVQQPLDDLAKRAQYAEREWLKANGARSIDDLPRKSKPRR